jgi:Protein of unknown function (DUF2917)
MTIQVSNSRIILQRSPDDGPQTGGCLGAQEIESLAGLQMGDSIICTNGVLWVTQEGDLEDYLLRKGEIFVSNSPGLVLVQAIDDSACWQYLE